MCGERAIDSNRARTLDSYGFSIKMQTEKREREKKHAFFGNDCALFYIIGNCKLNMEFNRYEGAQIFSFELSINFILCKVHTHKHTCALRNSD